MLNGEIMVTTGELGDEENKILVGEFFGFLTPLFINGTFFIIVKLHKCPF